MKSATIALRRGVVATVLALGAAQPASATTIISFNFTDDGSAVFAPCTTTPDCVQGSAFGLADDTGDKIPGSWSTSLDFTALTTPGTLSGTFSFLDIGPSTNDLFGTFTGTTNGTTGLISYLVTGGDGIFSGFRGTGSSTLTVSDVDPTGFADFSEVGSFVVSVPEPATISLLFAAAGAIGITSRRRRKSP